ncbi:unnamed protein product [Calypogeia fissa]
MEGMIMASNAVVGSSRPCQISLAEKTGSSGRPWTEVGGWKPNSGASISSRSSSFCTNQIPFSSSTWMSDGQHGFSKLGHRLLSYSSGGYVVSADSTSRPKPPVFVLKKPQKPQRTAPGSDENETSRNSLFEAEGSEDDRFSVGENHKSGYVALIGKPNVGKSTLLNQIIGQKLSIVTSKPQTTRHRILGICSTPEYQIILYDTPGVMSNTMRRLDEMMMQNVRSATVNADCILVIVDACQDPDQIMEVFEEERTAMNEKRPTLIVLNKMDLIKPGEITRKTELYQAHGHVDGVLPISAKFGRGVDKVKEWVVSQLPKGPAYFPKDIVSEHPERFFVSEIIREKIFLQYQKEIPYVSQVNVMNYTERVGTAKDFIEAEIVVERDSQLAILIGKDGAALKLLATASRLDIEEFMRKEVYLELKVKVRGKWREDDELLDYYGYSGKIRN